VRRLLLAAAMALGMHVAILLTAEIWIDRPSASLRDQAKGPVTVSLSTIGSTRGPRDMPEPPPSRVPVDQRRLRIRPHETAREPLDIPEKGIAAVPVPPDAPVPEIRDLDLPKAPGMVPEFNSPEIARIPSGIEKEAVRAGASRTRGEGTLPKYRERTAPHYPESARKKGWEGTVILSALIGLEGTAKEIEVVESSGHRVLDQAAMRGLKEWRFEPGTRNGRKIAMRVKIPVLFRLRE